MREGFRAIVSGWTLVDDFDDLTDRIERSAEWVKANGPPEPDEAKTVELMIRCQIVRGMPEFAHFLTPPGGNSMTTHAIAAALRRMANVAASADRAAVLAEAADRLAELAELAADGERLDFLQAHGLALEPETCRSPKWWRVSRPGWMWDYHGDTARQAIDQAREHRDG